MHTIVFRLSGLDVNYLCTRLKVIGWTKGCLLVNAHCFSIPQKDEMDVEYFQVFKGCLTQVGSGFQWKTIYVVYYKDISNQFCTLLGYDSTQN